MFGLKTLPTKPQPIAIAFDPLPDLAEYEAVGQVLKFKPPQIDQQRHELRRRELVGFMLDEGMPIYDNAEVHKYMAALARQHSKEYRFVWLKVSDSSRERSLYSFAREPDDFVRWVNRQDHGAFMTEAYPLPIPLNILKRAASVVKKFPTVEIYASHFAVHDPDPFICAKFYGSEHVVFGVWDEPGFKAIGRDAKPEQGDGR